MKKNSEHDGVSRSDDPNEPAATVATDPRQPQRREASAAVSAVNHDGAVRKDGWKNRRPSKIAAWNDETAMMIPPTTVLFLGQVGRNLSTPIQDAFDTGLPSNLSYGFISGYCSGMALKRIGRFFAFALGLGFVALQSLSYYGYIKLNHAKIVKDLESLIVALKDGGGSSNGEGRDGQASSDDDKPTRTTTTTTKNRVVLEDATHGARAFQKLMHILTFHVPCSVGFTAGFVGGFRSG